VLICVQLLLGPMLGLPGWRYVGLALLILSGVASYALLGRMLGAFHMSELGRSLRRVSP